MLDNIQSLIIDMDGVLWHEDTPIGDLPGIFSRIRSRGWNFAFATNNATRTPVQYRERLAGFGIDVDERQVVTSALGVAQLMKEKIAPGSSIFVVGEEGLRVALQDQGYRISSSESTEDVRAVVLGYDRGISLEKMNTATLLVRHGVPFYATNPDRTFPTPLGEIPGAGAWISVVTTATGIQPIFAGKPHPFLMDMALERLGTGRQNTLVIGDRLETDIVAGQAAGCPTALVLSGVSTQAQAEAWKPAPDLVVPDLGSLVNKI